MAMVQPIRRFTCAGIILGAVALTAFEASPAHAYCTGTFEVPPSGWDSYECTDDVSGSGATIIAVAGHRPSDGKSFVDVSCENNDCRGGVASISGYTSDWVEACFIDTTGPEATAYCSDQIAYYVFLLDTGPE
jgi:hypothetical protein